MGYIDSLFSAQTEVSGVAVSETSDLISVHSIAGHSAVYRHLKSAGKAEDKQQKQAAY